MKPAPFTYHRPGTIDEAVETLAATEGKVLAGGQSLIPIMSMRLASPTDIVDINHLPGLDVISVHEDEVRIGSLVRHRALELSRETPQYNWLLEQALGHVAHPTIRNRGTTVGSLVHADPAAEMPGVLCLLGGSVEAVSAARGRRLIDAADFFVGPLESALQPDELAVGATFRNPAPNSGTWWMGMSRRHGDYALVGVGAMVTLDLKGRLVAGSLVLIGVGPVPLVVDLTELLAEQRASILMEFESSLLGAVSDRVSAVVEPDGDIHATAEFRAHLAGVLSRRCLVGAARNAVDVPYDGDEDDEPTGEDIDDA